MSTARHRGRDHHPRRARRRLRLLQPRAGGEPRRGPLRQPTADDGDASPRSPRPPDRSCRAIVDSPGRGRRRAHPRPPGHVALEERVLRRQRCSSSTPPTRSGGRGSRAATSPPAAAASSSPPRPPRTSGCTSATRSRSPIPFAPGRPASAPPRATSRSSRSTPTRSAGSPTCRADQAGLFGLAGATNAVETPAPRQPGGAHARPLRDPRRRLRRAGIGRRRTRCAATWTSSSRSCASRRWSRSCSPS